MTEDLLERRLSAALGDRGAQARPGTPRFDDVERRASRRRRRRSAELAAVGVASAVLLVVGVLAVGASRGAGPADVTTTPASDPTVSAPAHPTGDRWAVLGGMEPDLSELAVTTTVGVQPSSGGMQGIEVTPYLIAGPSDADHDIVYALDGSVWTTTLASYGSADSAVSASTRVIRGSGFDATRFTLIPNRQNSFRPDASARPDPAAGTRNPFENARPEVVLAAPESHAVTGATVERYGGLDWVVLPEQCRSGPDRCRTTAVGGDADEIVLVDIDAPGSFDVRAALAGIELRGADGLARAPGWDPPTSDPLTAATLAAPIPGWSIAPFLTVLLPIVHDDSVWPAEVPTDYCTAYRQWKQIQIDHLGSFGTPGWIRWAEALDVIAPDGVGDAYRTLADEEAAGHDVSASQPGSDALSVVTTDGDARCP